MDDSNKETFEKYEAPSVEGCIIDGATLVQMSKPLRLKAFRQYCRIEISGNVERIANRVERVNIVFDVCRKASRKRETCEGEKTMR